MVVGLRVSRRLVTRGNQKRRIDTTKPERIAQAARPRWKRDDCSCKASHLYIIRLHQVDSWWCAAAVCGKHGDCSFDGARRPKKVPERSLCGRHRQISASQALLSKHLHALPPHCAPASSPHCTPSPLRTPSIAIANNITQHSPCSRSCWKIYKRAPSGPKPYGLHMFPAAIQTHPSYPRVLALQSE